MKSLWYLFVYVTVWVGLLTVGPVVSVLTRKLTIAVCIAGITALKVVLLRILMVGSKWSAVVACIVGVVDAKLANSVTRILAVEGILDVAGVGSARIDKFTVHVIRIVPVNALRWDAVMVCTKIERLSELVIRRTTGSAGFKLLLMCAIGVALAAVKLAVNLIIGADIKFFRMTAVVAFQIVRIVKFVSLMTAVVLM